MRWRASTLTGRGRVTNIPMQQPPQSPAEVLATVKFELGVVVEAGQAMVKVEISDSPCFFATLF